MFLIWCICTLSTLEPSFSTVSMHFMIFHIWQRIHDVSLQLFCPLLQVFWLLHFSQVLLENILLPPDTCCNSTPCPFAAAAAKSLQSCPTLCDPIDGSPPGSPVPGILQAITLEWVAISFSSAWKWKVKVKSLSHVWLFANPWTAAYPAPPSRGFSRQEYWSGVPLPSPPVLWSRLKYRDCIGQWNECGSNVFL